MPFCRVYKRMMGLELTAFCMANASSRSPPFAPVRSNGLFAEVSMQATEQDRTRANAEPCHPCHAAIAGFMFSCHDPASVASE
jgi:hypothetical protein